MLLMPRYDCYSKPLASPSPLSSRGCTLDQVAARKRPVKYLIATRNPVDRVWSAFKFYMEKKLAAYRRPEMVPNYEPSAQYFHTWVVAQIEKFQDCVFGPRLAGDSEAAADAHKNATTAIRRCVVEQHTQQYDLLTSMYSVNIKTFLHTTGTKLGKDVKVLPLSLLKESQGLGRTVNELYVGVGLGCVCGSSLGCM